MEHSDPLDIKTIITGLCLDPLSFFSMLVLTLHMHRYDINKFEFFLKQMKKTSNESIFLQYIIQK
jgi:hypothetical protein